MQRNRKKLIISFLLWLDTYLGLKVSDLSRTQVQFHNRNCACVLFSIKNLHWNLRKREMDCFVILTNRLVQKALESVLLELAIHKKKSYIIVIDNTTDEIVLKLNKACIATFNNKNILYIDLYQQKKLIDRISILSGYNKKFLMELLLAKECDYGKIFNFSYLVATILSCDTIHRRDSDCFVQALSKNKYPILEEEKFLKRKIREVENDIINETNIDGEERIYIAGSDYIGDWNFDVKLLQQEGGQVLHKLYQLSNFSEKDIPLVVQQKYEDIDQNRPPKAVLNSSSRYMFWAEGGNISMYKIFQWVPNFIGRHAVGFDYHTYNMTCIWNVPSIYHLNRIEHKHEMKRKQEGPSIEYWKGILKMNDYNLLLREYAEVVGSQIMNTKMLCKIIKSGELPKQLKMAHTKMNLEERLKNIDMVVDILNSSNIEKFNCHAKTLSALSNDIIAEVDLDYAKSFELQEIWNKLIYICQKEQDDLLQIIKE